MLLIVSWSFIICNIPSNILTILAMAGFEVVSQNDQLILLLTQTYYFNLFINPIIYGFKSPYFRQVL